jgi:hypothetical protein
MSSIVSSSLSTFLKIKNPFARSGRKDFVVPPEFAADVLTPGLYTWRFPLCCLISLITVDAAQPLPAGNSGDADRAAPAASHLPAAL